MTSTNTRTTRNRPGDVVEDAEGIAVATHKGLWYLSDREVLDLTTHLVAALKNRLTRPWSAEDESTILSRGKRS